MKWARWMISCLLLLCCGAAADDSGGADPHGQLNDILQRPMYQRWQLRQAGTVKYDDPALVKDFSFRMEQLSKLIGEFFSWLFRGSGGRSSGSGGSGASVLPTILKTIGWAAIIVTLIFVAVLLFKMLRDSGKNQMPARVLSRQQVQEALEAGDALAMNSAQWVGEAKRLAEEENFRAVYRALYLALLAGLHTLGKIDFNRNRTNWTYVQRYRGPADERVSFGQLTDRFDRVWYGLKRIESADLQHCQSEVARLTSKGGNA